MLNISKGEKRYSEIELDLHKKLAYEKGRASIIEELEKIETQIIRNSRPQWEKLVIDVTTCQLLIKERIEELKGE